MEQYWTPKELDFEHLALCLKAYTPNHLFIRDCGGFREGGRYSPIGKVFVSESLENKSLTFLQKGDELSFFIDGTRVFSFPLQNYYKGFSVAYERRNAQGILIALSTGIDPYDSSLLEPETSMLRNIIDDHLLEITFKGRIHLQFHSWQKGSDGEYWKIIPPPVP